MNEIAIGILQAVGVIALICVCLRLAVFIIWLKIIDKKRKDRTKEPGKETRGKKSTKGGRKC